MGIFGWDLPPGCSYNDLPGNQPDPPCDICGNDFDSCICPTCPVCEGIGDLYCYEAHGLVRTEEQILSLAYAEACWEDDARNEAKFFDEWEKEEIELRKLEDREL